MRAQVAQAVIVGLNATNPGCSGAMQLRQLVKPAVDVALGHAGPPSGATRTTPGGVPEWQHALRMGFDDSSAKLWRELSEAFERLELHGEGREEGDGPDDEPGQHGAEQVEPRAARLDEPEGLAGLKGWLIGVLEAGRALWRTAFATSRRL